MEPENINRRETKTHSMVSVSKITFAEEKPGKSGLLKRFLDWIAKGADELHMGRTSCPT